MAGDEDWDYGDIAVRFKGEIRERATFTVGDSLDQVSVADEENLARRPLRYRVVPHPVQHPSWLAVPRPVGDVLDYPNAGAFVEAMPSTSPVLHYVEAQYHGAVTLADVEEVIFLKKPPSEETRKLLEQAGIPYQEARKNGESK